MSVRDAAQLDTSPYWADSASMPRFAKLDRDEHADVVVVGGGITGLTDRLSARRRRASPWSCSSAAAARRSTPGTPPRT